MNSEVRLIEVKRFQDSRGWFEETFNVETWAGYGIDAQFVQDNHSYSKHAGTIRGIHFQTPPHGQGKLVRCVRGRIDDYAIDLRRGSPTYGKHVCYELTPDNGRQLWVPVGFGHAFVTLEPDTEVVYKVTSLYAAGSDGGIRWNDPDLAIDWTLPERGPTLSAKDEALPVLTSFDSPFVYDGNPLVAA